MNFLGKAAHPSRFYMATAQISTAASSSANTVITWPSPPPYVETWHKACAQRAGIKTHTGKLPGRYSCAGCGRTIALRKAKEGSR